MEGEAQRQGILRLDERHNCVGNCHANTVANPMKGTLGRKAVRGAIYTLRVHEILCGYISIKKAKRDYSRL